MTRKIEIIKKTRPNSKNKQTFGLKLRDKGEMIRKVLLVIDRVMFITFKIFHRFTYFEIGIFKWQLDFVPICRLSVAHVQWCRSP